VGGPRLGRRLGALVLRDGAQALAGVLVPLVIALAWLQRSDPPPALRAALIALDPPKRAVVLVAIVVGIVVLGAPAVRTVLASRRLEPWRALPIGPGWWQRRLALHLFVLDMPWWIALGYGVATFDRETAILVALGGAGFLVAVQVGIVALADRPALRLVGWTAVLATAGVAWTFAPPPIVGLVGIVAAIPALVRMRRPWPEPRPPGGGRIRIRTPALAWARLLVLHWRRHAPNHFVGVIALQLVLLSGVALAASRDVPDGPWLGLARGLAIAGALAGASGVLVAVRATDRERGWFDATPLSIRDELRGRGLTALLGTAPTLMLAPVIAIVGGAPGWRALEPVVVVAWAIAVVLAIVAGRESAFDLHEPAWRRFVVVLVVAEGLVLAIGTAALVPWIATAAIRTRDTAAAVGVRRRRFDLPSEAEHG